MGLDVLQDGTAEPDHALNRASEWLPRDRPRRAQDLVNAAEQQIVLVAEMGVESRAPDVGAVQDLLDRDVVVGLLVQQRRERLANQRFGPLDPAILGSLLVHAGTSLRWAM